MLIDLVYKKDGKWSPKVFLHNFIYNFFGEKYNKFGFIVALEYHYEI